MRPCWVTLEGVEGVGKTHLAGMLAARLGGRCQMLSEVTDHQPRILPSRVITALSRTGDLWLRTGHPATETLALLALKAGEHERIRTWEGIAAEIILEDRGVDSVAVYQALILAGPGAPNGQVRDLMELIYATAGRWRPPPDLTLLLTDDLDTCISRLEQRTGRTIAAADRELISRAAQLYADQAAREPDRFKVINRGGRTAADTVDELVRACTTEPGTTEQPCMT
jgi:dTMP kinase